ncbi:MAG: SUMF1/EgtB/PvdO family nonheme iron enzyme [Bryobacteraceae bacterium]
MAGSTLGRLSQGRLGFRAGVPILVFTLGLTHGARAQSFTPNEALQQAGVCSRCHVAQVLEWSASRHTRTGTVCQSCHGPSAGHVANERNQVKPDRLPRDAAIAGLCATCHTAGCTRTRETANCQSCHHPHALVNPNAGKLAPIADPAEQRREEYTRRMAAGERLAEAADWKAALAEFRAALDLSPNDRRAKAKARLCERRIDPAIPGFEILEGAGFDAESGLALRVKASGIEMALMPGAEFEIGADALAGAKPLHAVRIEPFYLGVREITQSEWRKFASEDPSVHKGDALPVNNVSWEDATGWIAAVNTRIQGGGFRLPTEAEWEYAARAEPDPLTPVIFKMLEDIAWYRDNSRRENTKEAPFYEADAYAPRAAGSRQPTGRGFHDLRGNVWEWCSTLLAPYPYDARDGRESPSGQGLRVLRGGGYADSTLDPRLRHSDRPSRRQPWYGFRLARSVPD